MPWKDWDDSQDKILASVTIGDELEAKLASYKEGAPKIQISRFYAKKDGTKSFAKLGRMSIEESEAVFKALPDLIAKGKAAVAIMKMGKGKG